ncbi:hypothetical protein [Methylobacter sp.]|nr:hypothetical protein [Methylobacter sp.]MDI1275938.1 hypothetical protein [Methylobacter sp.]MDI1356680.1 hypothetical protein [Methylobacter sp.]
MRLDNLTRQRLFTVPTLTLSALKTIACLEREKIVNGLKHWLTC